MKNLLSGDIKQMSLEQQAQQLLLAAPYLAAKLSCHGDIGTYTPLQALVEVLKFLALSSKADMITPSIRVDLAWHQFILSTQLYSEYCAKCYDKYLHHTPSDATLANQQQFEYCLQLYRQHFGAPAPWFWGPVWQTSSDGNCSACETT